MVTMTLNHFDYLISTIAPIFIVVIISFLVIIKLIEVSKNPKKKLQELSIDSPENAHGIIFGKKKKKVVYSKTDNEGSVGVFSATGTGKTSAIGIPTLRSWTGTSFTIDISGDICRNCPNMQHKLIFEPENLDTIPYNIFGTIDALQNPDDQNESLEQLAYLLIPDSATNDNAKFFADGGRKILTAALIAYYHQNIDFCQICEKIIATSWKNLFCDIDNSKNNTAIMYINSFQGASEQNTAGCKQSCDDALKLFATNVKIKNSIRRPEKDEIAITPQALESYNIFLIIDDPKLTLYSPLLNIICNQMMQYISNRNVTKQSNTILLFLDEYASLRLDSITILEALRKYRKRKCRVMILTQNLADLIILYGRETTKAILSNLRFKVLLGGLGETESQKYFADLIGYQETKKYSKSTSNTQVTHTETQTKEYIIDPAQLDRQGKDTVILLHPDQDGYMLLKKNYYFK